MVKSVVVDLVRYNSSRLHLCLLILSNEVDHHHELNTHTHTHVRLVQTFVWRKYQSGCVCVLVSGDEAQMDEIRPSYMPEIRGKPNINKTFNFLSHESSHEAARGQKMSLFSSGREPVLWSEQDRV